MTAASTEEDEKELALKIANECITEVPVMVLGSGASCAYGIRGMCQLSEYLIERVTPETEDSESWDAFKAELAQHSDLEEALQKVAVSDHLHREIVSHTRHMILEDDLHNINKNFISLRDYATQNKYQFFLHFEKEIESKENTHQTR